MRKVEVQSPSFPTVESERPLQPREGAVWQVLCGDAGHWRVGIYSPVATRPEDCPELERHTCPEFFLLLRGQLTLLIAEAGAVRELVLEAGRPVLIEAPHTGFCPEGPHGGAALVVERDAFATEYRAPQEWLAQLAAARK